MDGEGRESDDTSDTHGEESQDFQLVNHFWYLLEIDGHFLNG